jgi:hypothetical protein
MRCRGQLIEAFTAELGIPRRILGQMTWRRHDLDQGLEADECYYILNQPVVSRRVEVDLERDPPPDLALEVVVSHGDVNKMTLYAASGVPEVWYWDDGDLQVCELQESCYVPREMSSNLPMLRVKDLERFLDPLTALDESGCFIKRHTSKTGAECRKANRFNLLLFDLVVSMNCEQR